MADFREYFPSPQAGDQVALAIFSDYHVYVHGEADRNLSDLNAADDCWFILSPERGLRSKERPFVVQTFLSSRL